VVIDEKIAKELNQKILNLAREIAASSVDLVQLRAKNTNDTQYLSLAKKLTVLFKKKNKIFIVNDRADIAYLSGANGVHLGASDVSEEEARIILGKKAIVGKTIHSLKEIKSTSQSAVDYLSLGPFFESKTKQPNRRPLTRKEINRIISENEKLIFAIGGINLYNIDSVLKSGIKNVAVSSSVLSATHPLKKIEELKRCLKKVS